MRWITTIIGVLSLVLGLLNLLIGYGEVVNKNNAIGGLDLIAGLLFVLASVVAIPSVQDWLRERTGRPDNEGLGLRWALILALAGLAIFVYRSANVLGGPV